MVIYGLFEFVNTVHNLLCADTWVVHVDFEFTVYRLPDALIEIPHDMLYLGSLFIQIWSPVQLTLFDKFLPKLLTLFTGSGLTEPCFDGAELSFILFIVICDIGMLHLFLGTFLRRVCDKWVQVTSDGTLIIGFYVLVARSTTIGVLH